MTQPFRFEPPTPLQYFAALVADDEGFPLLEAAIAVAQDEYPDLDPQAVLAEVDALAERLRRRLPQDAAKLQRLRMLNHFFFQEMGFGGNVNDYYDRRNSYLPHVLRTRRGIPITLALIYLELAGQIELQASGVSFPGHFLVKLHLPRGEVIIDPFTGHSLSREQLDERLAPFRQEHGLVGDFEAPLGLYLQSATPRAVIARLLRNLKEIHRGAHDWPRLLAVLDRLVVLQPDDWAERRDRGLVRAELGAFDEAADDIAAYLEHQPGAGDVVALKRRLQSWRRRGRPLLH